MNRTMEFTADMENALWDIVDYLYEDEKADFLAQDRPSDHIFHSLLILASFSSKLSASNKIKE